MVSESSTSPEERVDVVIVGAGFTGLQMLKLVSEAGFEARLLEAGQDIGGTWYWNRYPGARTDSEVMAYRYTSDLDFERSWEWNKRYAVRTEIVEYLSRFVDRHGIRSAIQLNARVEGAEFDEATNTWTVKTADGKSLRTTFFCTAVGNLSEPLKPDFKGFDSFEGQVLYTARWPEDEPDLAGKRIGVIGTGSSGVQVIPILAETASHLTVFQRSATFVLPARNHEIDPDFEKEWKDKFDFWMNQMRNNYVGLPYDLSTASALSVSDEEREATFQSAWERGSLSFLWSTYGDLAIDVAAGQTAIEFLSRKIDEIVKDPAVADKLKQKFQFAAKRMPLGEDYYETFNRSNVTLVDVSETPITEVTPDGIRTGSSLHELDVIVMATGFDAVTGALLGMDVRGRNGISLRDRWAEGPETYLGMAVSGFPNMLTLAGPGSPGIFGNIPPIVEYIDQWAARFLEYVREHGISCFESTKEADAEWTAHVAEVAPAGYGTVSSWFNGGNVPGKPRRFSTYAGGLPYYRELCQKAAEAGYAGFVFDGADAHSRWSSDSTQSEEELKEIGAI